MSINRRYKENLLGNSHDWNIFCGFLAREKKKARNLYFRAF
ncbi:hypothetical protein HMPREF9439_00494 [Parasutterella excrementihominis YIT 11859]|uniref:Uncharacterized protein n=1 Tax=Parasutterella excrementihominis YIT 11859 TaxID=762966 RepID=F3QHU7_9BURK|nr:hypothetical protein HMPREF9439_00494 [Parasutterella excrementihominis YIT 11859]